MLPRRTLPLSLVWAGAGRTAGKLGAMLPRRTLPLSAVSLVAERTAGKLGAMLPRRTLPLSTVSLVAGRTAGRLGAILPGRTLPLSFVSNFATVTLNCSRMFFSTGVNRRHSGADDSPYACEHVIGVKPAFKFCENCGPNTGIHCEIGVKSRFNCSLKLGTVVKVVPRRR